MLLSTIKVPKKYNGESELMKQVLRESLIIQHGLTFG